jgi:dCMP deaminase
VRPTVDETWLGVCEVIAQRSRCSRAKVGTVIIAADGRIESSGYNGPPRGYDPVTLDESCSSFCAYAKNPAKWSNGNYDACPSVHSETNAIAHVDRTRIAGGTLYVSSSCCMTCAKLVANSGVVRVVMKIKKSQSYRDYEGSIEFLKSCGIEVWEVHADDE